MQYGPMHFLEILAHLQSLLSAFEADEGPLPDREGPAISLTASCHRELIGRVIGRDGATIKAIQMVTGAALQVDQACDPCTICLQGCAMAVSAANAMILDIQSGVFSGFVLLRTVAALLEHPIVQREGLIAVTNTPLLGQLPFYVPKLGFIDRDVAEQLGLVRPFALLRFLLPFNIKCVPAVFLDTDLLAPLDPAAAPLRSSNSFINTFHSWASEKLLFPTLCAPYLLPSKNGRKSSAEEGSGEDAETGTIHAAQDPASQPVGEAADFCPWERHRDDDGRTLFRNRITGEICEPLGSSISKVDKWCIPLAASTGD